MDEILWCYHSNETSTAVLSHGIIYLLWGSSRSVDEMVLQYTYKTSSVVRLHSKVFPGICN